MSAEQKEINLAAGKEMKLVGLMVVWSVDMWEQ